MVQHQDHSHLCNLLLTVWYHLGVIALVVVAPVVVSVTGLGALGEYVLIIVIGIIPFNVIGISISDIGSMSSMYFIYLLLMTIATLIWCSVLLPSPLEYQLYSFLCSIVLCLTCVCCSSAIWIMFLFINVSISFLFSPN